MGQLCFCRNIRNTSSPAPRCSPTLLHDHLSPFLDRETIDLHTKPASWTLPSPDSSGRARVGHEPPQLVRPAACARPGATIPDPSVVTVPLRGLNASIPRLRRILCSKFLFVAISFVGYFEAMAAKKPIAASQRGPIDSSNHEILSRLGHISSLLEEIKQDGGSTISSSRSLRSSFFETGVQSNSSREDLPSGSNNLHGSSPGLEHRADDHDPLKLYAANSPEYMLRWPVFNKVITDSERHIRSFLLDSLDSQPQSGMPPPRQVGIGLLLDDIPQLCEKYLKFIHRRNPIVEREKLMRYAREVTVQGLGWDGQSCQVVRIHPLDQLS